MEDEDHEHIEMNLANRRIIWSNFKKFIFLIKNIVLADNWKYRAKAVANERLYFLREFLM